MLRGEVYYANLGNNGIGSEQNGDRPVVIIQNNKGNLHSPTVIVAMISTCNLGSHLPVHVQIDRGDAGINEPSTILCEQIRTLDKSRLRERMGCLNPTKLEKLNKALKISLGL